MEKKELVGRKEIMESLDGEKGAVRLTRHDVLGAGVIIALLTPTIVFTTMILVYWIIMTHSHPSDADAILQRAMKMYDAVVSKTFWPPVILAVSFLLGRGSVQGTAKSE